DAHNRQIDLATDFSGNDFVVTREYFHADPVSSQCCNGPGGRFLRRIQKRDVTQQGQPTLILQGAGVTPGREIPDGDGNYPESVGIQTFNGGAKLLVMSGVQGKCFT